MIKRIFISTVAVLLSVTSVQAKDTSKDPEECEQALHSSGPIPVLDYAVSDLEGLFFAYLKKLQAYENVSSNGTDLYIKEVLSMKAEVLNRVGDLLLPVAYSPMPDEKRTRMISSIFQMIDTLGLPAKIFGFEINEDGRPVLPVSAEAREAALKASKTRDLVPEKNPIGFLPTTVATRDLPDHLARSIGFRDHQIREHARPQRTVGRIGRRLIGENQDVLLVVDVENGISYALPLGQLQVTALEIPGRRYELQFNPEVREWVVISHNLNNPTGRIGF